MLQGIATAGNSLISPLRQCARCSRNASTRTSKGVKDVYLGRRVSTASATATESTISIDDTPNTYSVSTEAGPSRDRRNVWTRMQQSPKRQCILTRKTLPADYLLKLKPLSYPEDEKGNYLTPSIVNKCDPGRSFYLTLHREVIARIHEPGPHLGILAQNNIQIPRKLDEWIQALLEERLMKELDAIVNPLKKATLTSKNTIPEPNARGVISRNIEKGDLDQLIIHLPHSSTLFESTNPSEIDLRSLSPSYHSQLFDNLNSLLATDRTYLLRQALANKLPLSKELIGKRGLPKEALEGTSISLSSGSQRGQLVLPVMVALLRLKLYSGQGWETQL